MPQVPVSRGNTVQLRPREVNAIRPIETGGEQVGQAIARFGEAGARAVDQQSSLYDQLDQTAARQLVLDYRSQADPLVNEYTGMQGGAAVGERTGVEAKLKAARSDLAAKATSPNMRRYFDEMVGQQEAGYLDTVGKHGITQLKVQQVGVARGEQGFAEQDARMNWSNPAKYQASVDAGLKAIDDEGKLSGADDVSIGLAKTKFKSGVRKGVVDQLLADNRQDDAIGYAGVHRDELTADDNATVSKLLKEPMELRFAVSGADTVMGGKSAPNVPAGQGVAFSGASLFKNGIVPIEGGTGKGGQFLTSPKGAVGPAQVMPDTAPEAARLAGVPYDERRYKSDHGYNLQLGEAYFKEQLRSFGDPLKAAAAYNAGAGRTRDAMAKAKAAGKPSDWQSYLPRETQGYVSSFAKRMGASGTADGVDQQEVYSRLDAVATDQGWSPEQKRTVQAEVDRRVARSEHLKTAAESSAYDASVSKAVSLGDSFTDVSQLGSSFHNMSPQQQLTMTKMADANRKALLTGEKTPAYGDVYIGLSNMSREATNDFLSTNLEPYRARMTPSEFSTLQGAQSKLRAGGDKEVSLRASIASTITFYSKIDGQKLDPKDNGKQFTNVFDDMNGFLGDLTERKRRPTDAELKAAYDRATLTVQTPGRIWGTNDKHRYEVEPGQPFTAEIPTAVRSRIVSAAGLRGRNLTENQITQAYIAGKGTDW